MTMRVPPSRSTLVMRKPLWTSGTALCARAWAMACVTKAAAA